MSDTILRKNIQLLNMVDKKIPYHDVLALIHKYSNREIGVIEIESFFRDNLRICHKILDAFDELDRSYFSLNCLLYFGLNFITIENLKNHFLTLDHIGKNISLLDSLNLRATIYNSIYASLKALDLLPNAEFNFDGPIEDEIVWYISKHEPCPNNALKEYILNKHMEIESSEYDGLVDYLLRIKKINLSTSGFKIKKNDLIEYLESSENKKDAMILKKIRGMTLNEIKNDLGITRQRVQQIIENRLSKLPVFSGEESLAKILSIYKLSNEELNILKLDVDLAEFIKLRYKIKPKKTGIDYVVDFKLFNTNQGKEILSANNMVFVKGNLLQLSRGSFSELFYLFTTENEIYSFDLEEIWPCFNKFLNDQFITEDSLFFSGDNDLVLKSRKLLKSSDFINVNGHKFLVYRPGEISYDFLQQARQFLDEFEGYGSAGLFFENNKDLCLANHINDENELFALLKKVFAKEYDKKIEFIRNPTLMRDGINKERYLENLILDMELPCTVADYLDYVHKVTGLKQSSVLANFNNMINQFKNCDGLLSLEDDLTEEETEALKSVLGDRKCVGFNYIKELLEIRYGDKSQIFLNGNILKKIGYSKTDTCIYKDIYPNRISAVVDCLQECSMIVSEIELYKIANIEYFYYRVFDASEECLVLKISEGKYLNLIARGQSELVKKIKTALINACDDNEFYSLDNFIEEQAFKDLLEIDDEFKELLFAFDTRQLLKSIISTERKFNYIDSKNAFIFSKSELSLKLIIQKIMNSNEILLIGDLHEILYNEYGIEKNFSNKELADMGFYCPASSEKVYLNIDYYSLEMEDVLNGNS